MYRYEAVYLELKKQIENGTYEMGTTLPPEIKLANQFNVDRSTIRKAIQLLSELGCVERKPGIGTRLISTDVETPDNHGKTTESKTNTLEGRRIGFILSNKFSLSDNFHSTLYSYLDMDLKRIGASLIYANYDQSLEPLVKVLSLDAVILVSTDDNAVQEALEIGIPCILVNNYHKSVPSIIYDNFHGAYLATKHIIEHGHKDILVLEGLKVQICNDERIQGFKMAISEAGIPLDKNKIISVKATTIEDAASCVKEYLDTHLDCRSTAIIGLNDTLAFGALRALHQLGYTVPEDISVIGFGNLNDRTMSVQNLTTVEGHIEIIARAAFSQIWCQMFGNKPIPIKIISPVDIVTGETVTDINK